MLSVLVGTSTGCLKYAEDGKVEIELPDRRIGPIFAEVDGTCLAVVDGQELWRRNAAGIWNYVAPTGLPVQSIGRAKESIYVGGEDEAVLLRISRAGEVERVESFDHVPGRKHWFSGGPPLGVRSLAAAMDGGVLLAAVHVGGLPRSSDEGRSWTPTIPVMYDVHEVRSHPELVKLVVAAAAVGLCVSTDAGMTWKVFAPAAKGTTCLAVGVLEKEVLFSVQEGPFAKQSQIWRWRIGGDHIDQVRDGFPAWLKGKVDTNWIACDQTRAAVIDGEGNLWLSETGSIGWKQIAGNVLFAQSIAILS